MTLATTLMLALLAATNPSSDGGPSDPILLDFHADWCGPCRQMAPAVNQLGRKGYPVQKVNIDRSPELARRYGVEAVPTFVVVDRSGRELDRTSGLQPAASLERFYLAARAKAGPDDRAQAEGRDRDRDRDAADVDDADEAPAARPVRRTGRQPAGEVAPDRADDGADDRGEDDDRPAKPFTNPHPIKTVVRIKVQGAHSTGFGSGTIIYSSPEQSIILTCAHIFKLEGRAQQVSPRQFPHKIVIDLFDGQLHPQAGGGSKADYVESYPGRAVDYDFNLDVGLIVFRPGRQLASSRVVPAYWQPRSEPLPMRMITVGCSEGHDPTVWLTRVMNPRMRGFLRGQPSYEAIECERAPKQGRSGGGLFTTNGYIAGVCNFAEPQGNHGLYATPQSIYTILDRNNLASLYAPPVNGSGTMIAANRRPARTRPRADTAEVARTQSPDPEDEPAPRRRAAAPASSAPAEAGDVMLPHYSLLGIKEPVGNDGASAEAPRPAAAPAPAPGTTRRVAWHPNHAAAAAAPTATADDQVETSGTAPTPATTSPARPRWRPAGTAGRGQ